MKTESLTTAQKIAYVAIAAMISGALWWYALNVIADAANSARGVAYWQTALISVWWPMRKIAILAAVLAFVFEIIF